MIRIHDLKLQGLMKLTAVVEVQVAGHGCVDEGAIEEDEQLAGVVVLKFQRVIENRIQLLSVQNRCYR